MEIKRIDELTSFTEVISRCYPGMKLITEEEKKRFTDYRTNLNQEPAVEHYGLYDEGTLAGGSVHYLLPMNVYQQTMPTRGIGTVGIDLPYKKQGLAKQMIQHFITQAKDEGYPLVHLYPFKPDFYRRMGFGFGAQLSVFQFAPSQLPYFDDAPQSITLQSGDKEEIIRCYHRWSEKTHGALDKQEYEFHHIDMEHTTIIGCRKNGELQGYMIFQFKQGEGDHLLQHDLHITDWVAQSPEAFHSMINFLHKQKDQVRSIRFPTFNDDFVFLLNDPRHSSEELIFRIYHDTHRRGTGAMYRIVDIPLFIQYISHHSFGKVSMMIDFEVEDTLMGPGTQTYSCQFNNDGIKLVEGAKSPVTVSIDIADFSSLLMGCTTLKQLLYFGKAKATGEDDAINRAKQVFSNPEKPENWTFI